MVVDQSNVADMCYLLYKYYGTTMAGLKAVGYDLDYDDFHSFVHGRIAQPRSCFETYLTQPSYSKNYKRHASRALTRLGLEDCFDMIICFETLNPIDKADSQIGGATLASKIFDIMKYAAESSAM